jgi:hypothetical protein
MHTGENKLVEFLIEVADARELLEAYFRDPEAVMTEAGLSEAEKALIRAGELDAILAAVESRYPGRPITRPITGPFPRPPITIGGEESAEE